MKKFLFLTALFFYLLVDKVVSVIKKHNHKKGII